MNISIYYRKIIFYLYLGYIIFIYTRPVSIDRYLENVSGLDLDKFFHFITFLFLGVLAQLANNVKNEYIYGVTLAMIISLFIEFTHFMIPYRDFEILDGLVNIIACVIGVLIVKRFRSKQ